MSPFARCGPGQLAGELPGPGRSTAALLALIAFASCGSPTSVEPGGNDEVMWEPRAPLPITVLAMDGVVYRDKVYVAGGVDGSLQQVDGAFVYDPIADQWSRIASLPAPRLNMHLVVAGDSLYGIGGFTDVPNRAVTTNWVYLPDADRWEERAPLPAPRAAGVAATVRGQIFVAGGFSAPRRLADTTYVYDPDSNQWGARTPIPTPRDDLTAQVVDDRLYTIGGRMVLSTVNYDVVEVYDPVRDSWSPGSPMPTRRGGLASALINGRIHALGGELPTSVMATHEVYDVVSDSWSEGTVLPMGRHTFAAVGIGSRIYIIGGGGETFAALRTVEVLDVPN